MRPSAWDSVAVKSELCPEQSVEAGFVGGVDARRRRVRGAAQAVFGMFVRGEIVEVMKISPTSSGTQAGSLLRAAGQKPERVHETPRRSCFLSSGAGTQTREFPGRGKSRFTPDEDAFPRSRCRAPVASEEMRAAKKEQPRLVRARADFCPSAQEVGLRFPKRSSEWKDRSGRRAGCFSLASVRRWPASSRRRPSGEALHGPREHRPAGARRLAIRATGRQCSAL